MDTHTPHIRHTVYPDHPLTLPEWLSHVKAGSRAPNPEPRNRARDIQVQYRVDGRLNPAYIELIHRLEPML
jgi:hypothetical protein